MPDDHPTVLVPTAARRVALAEPGEGVRNTAAVTAPLIGRPRPEAVLFAGVADGRKADIALGDVVGPALPRPFGRGTPRARA
ncbi:hypothetical protein [Streptomyces sp. NPDC018347]|uniref:hypothetical protein n=1 Tax=Streptomyces sp. NPDC018347 TaxID=3157193 RepID=UPI0033EF29C6